MAKEIEKKFLVLHHRLPKLTNGTLYVQGYLSLKPLIRFRIVGKKVIITIKKVEENGISKEEWEFSNTLTKDEIDKLTKLSQKQIITKVRYKIKYNDLVWDLDVYQGENEGLITVDVEIPDENFQISFPDWVDSSLDITNDPKYFNMNLGDNPYQRWTKSPRSSKK